MTPLTTFLRDRLLAEGSMPFSSFMAEALYHPGQGYYATRRLRTGRGGDFFTSVSVGPVFGQIMAGEFCAAWERMGRPGRFTVIEAGANDGQFAFDVLSWLRAHRPDFLEVLTYQIDEPLAPIASIQRETLKDFQAVVSHDAVGRSAHGCYFANEVLDAIPCRRVRFTGGGWQELHVGLDADQQFCWEAREAQDETLKNRLAWLGNDFPEGYTTEIAPSVVSHLQHAAARLEQGYWFFADYGYAARDYYAPHRLTGTLRCYRDHRAHDDPFDAIGETDLTAHVDFSLAASTAVESGCQVMAFLDQARFLTAAAADTLRRMEQETPLVGTPWQRQFQTLTHPAHLGQKFHFLVLGKNVEDCPLPASLAFARSAAVEDLLLATSAPLDDES